MQTNPASILLFVYGTLKRGGCRHGPLARQRFRAITRTRPRYALYDLGDYPGLKADDATGQVVHGEVYEVDVALIPWLDAEEGAPMWFSQALVEVEGFSGPVWAYFYQPDATGRPRIESGEWDNGPGAGEGS